MLRWKRVEISAGALLLGAALYYLDEQGVLLMAFCACALHELGHWLVIRALGGRVTALRITCVGAEMRLSARCPLGCWQQIAAALAGPAVNLLAARMAAGLGTEGAYWCRLQPNHAEGHGWDENSACNPLRLVVNYCSLNKGWSSAAAAKGRRHPWLQEHL